MHCTIQDGMDAKVLYTNTNQEERGSVSLQSILFFSTGEQYPRGIMRCSLYAPINQRNIRSKHDTVQVIEAAQAHRGYTGVSTSQSARTETPNKCLATCPHRSDSVDRKRVVLLGSWEAQCLGTCFARARMMP